MKLLFVNACIRGEKSRTYELCLDYLEKFKISKKDQTWEIEELNLNDIKIEPLDMNTLSKRDSLVKEKNFDDSEFDFAKKIIEADHILIGAPYWDLSFPSKLKAFFERCSITGFTFIYSPEGIPEGKCKAQSLSYITTSGSKIGDFNFGYNYTKAICGLFGIKKTYFASAEELDIIGKDVQKIMLNAKDKITAIIDEL
ncbi:MAG: NAD(P)H dehydrogenase [Firmicutes bacterium]|jgi:FMN-dependent NADH-azoreductase|nr:NAD(P)H dehydrogenase [Bacillota bacterium]